MTYIIDSRLRGFDAWFNLAAATVRTSVEKAREIAAICHHDEESGGLAATWHASSIVHDNPGCVCAQCKFGRATRGYGSGLGFPL